MLKPYQKLKRLYQNCQTLSKIADQELYLKAFEKEFERIIKNKLKGKQFGNLVKKMEARGQAVSRLWIYLIDNSKSSTCHTEN